MGVFATLSMETIGGMISKAKQRIVYVAPGLFAETARQIICFAKTNGNECVELIVDSDPEVCRLGYGDIDSIQMLMNYEIKIRKAPGLRIGIIMVDEDAWIFAPIPLLVEEEPREHCPNAIKVTVEQAEVTINAISPIAAGITMDTQNSRPLKLITKENTPEIGTELVSSNDLQVAKDNLEMCPPQKFDLARRVQVYQSFIQFVDLRLTGCHLNRHTVSIPPKLLNVTRNTKVQERLKATYRLIDENSKLSCKDIEQAVKQLREKYIVPLGSKYGNIILKQKKDDFLKEIEKIQKLIQDYQKSSVKKLQKEFDKCKKQLINILYSAVKKNPPNDLLRSIPSDKPTTEQAKQYLDIALNKAIPSAEGFVSDMELDYHFKDVTYEMLNDPEFQNELRTKLALPKLFEEYEAAKANVETEQMALFSRKGSRGNC